MAEKDSNSKSDSSEEQRFGQVAVSLGFITEGQLQECLQEQAHSREKGSLLRIGQILMHRDFLTTEQFLKIMSEQETRYGGSEDRQTMVLGELLGNQERSSDDPLGPGKLLGRYKIIRQIGRGGMGIVYEAVDSVLKRKIALKVLREDMLDAGVAKRLEKEALTAARLKHPHIVTLYESGVIDGTRFLAMELVQGATLRDWLISGNITMDQKVSILEDVARAVEYAHTRGVVHRDLKPGNVMLDEESRPMIMDFGLARLLDDATAMSRKGAMVGTPGYMAPEQITGSGSVDGRTDIYALGVMMYELLSNRLPFDGYSAPEICRKIIETDPLPIEGLPPELAAILQKAMARDRMSRFATAGEFADELRRYREGEPVQVCPPTLMQSVQRTVRRHRAASTGITVMVLAVVLAFFFFLWFEGYQKRSRAEELLTKATESERQYENLSVRLLDLQTEIRKAEAKLNPRAPKVEKEGVWKMKQVREDLELELLRTEARIIGFCVAALSDDDLAAEKLLDFQWKRFLQSQVEGDQTAAEMYAESIRQMAEDRSLSEWIEKLDSGGRVGIDSTPRADFLDIYLFEESLSGPRETVEIEKDLSLPFRREGLKPGSYLFVLRKRGFREVRFPVLVGIGTETESNVRLLSGKDIGDQYVYVPAGPFISGDPKAYLGAPRKPSVFVDNFLIGKYEVTRAEYLLFLNDLLKKGFHDEALRYVPSDAIENSKQYRQIFRHDHRTESDFYLLEGLNPQAPVTSVRWADAEAYANWLSKKSGHTYRLPTGLEW
ncbi:MAG: protein kinase, partial [Planctomycetota bacterium]|nr:protein kinase [Planctomycetota bacterium]